MCMYPHEEPYARPGLGSRNLIQAKEYCCYQKLLNSVENTTETPWVTIASHSRSIRQNVEELKVSEWDQAADLPNQNLFKAAADHLQALPLSS